MQTGNMHAKSDVRRFKFNHFLSTWLAKKTTNYLYQHAKSSDSYDITTWMVLWQLCIARRPQRLFETRHLMEAQGLLEVLRHSTQPDLNHIVSTEECQKWLELTKAQIIVLLHEH